MKKIILFAIATIIVAHGFNQVPLKLTGGISLEKGTINGDLLKEVIQQKQEEVFTRLFSNIVVKYFAKKEPTDGVYNFATYYALYNLMTDLTVGKSKTTVSKAVINSMAELSYIYAFVKFYQSEQASALRGPALTSAENKQIENLQIVTRTFNGGAVRKDSTNLLLLNFYMEAGFDVLAKSSVIQDVFYFKRPISESGIEEWYNTLGLINNPDYNTRVFNDVSGSATTLPALILGMETKVNDFIAYATRGSDPILKIIAGLKKSATGFETLTNVQIDAVKLLLIEYANKTDYLFDQNIVKNVINLFAENTHIDIDASMNIQQVYVDVESLILSIDKELISKNRRSSVASGAFFVNPRIFFTIGASNSFFLNDDNRLTEKDGLPAPLKNITLASEKIGFRVKLWDGGYTKSFGPGEVYKFHGYNYVWTQPQKKPLISSVYYNFYGSGLLYNVLDLKTNQNFDFGYVATNVGLIFFNGLEFAAGVGIVYEDGIDAKNSFFKIDFDIPIVDYITALRNKQKDR